MMEWMGWLLRLVLMCSIPLKRASIFRSRDCFRCMMKGMTGWLQSRLRYSRKFSKLVRSTFKTIKFYLQFSEVFMLIQLCKPWSKRKCVSITTLAHNTAAISHFWTTPAQPALCALPTKHSITLLISVSVHRD